MTYQMKQQLMSGIPVHIENLPREYVIKLIEQIGFMEAGARFDIVVKHELECSAKSMLSCTCKECDLEITKENAA